MLSPYYKKAVFIDFGLSNTYKDSHDTLKTACGSPCYAAPEMIAGKRYWGKQVDIWSSGVVLYAMICGYLPFEDPETSKLYKKIMWADYEIPEWLSDAAVDMLARVLNTNPDKRYDVDDIMVHPWFTQVKHKPMPEETNFTNPKILPEVLDRVVGYGFDKEYTVRCL